MFMLFRLISLQGHGQDGHSIFGCSSVKSKFHSGSENHSKIMELEVFFFFYYFYCCKHKLALLTTHCPNGSVHSVALIIFLMRLVFTTACF